MFITDGIGKSVEIFNAVNVGTLLGKAVIVIQANPLAVVIAVIAVAAVIFSAYKYLNSATSPVCNNSASPQPYQEPIKPQNREIGVEKTTQSQLSADNQKVPSTIIKNIKLSTQPYQEPIKPQKREVILEETTQSQLLKETENSQASIQPTPKLYREPIKTQNVNLRANQPSNFRSDNLGLRSTNSTLKSNDKSGNQSLRSTKNSTLKSKWVCPKILEDNNLDECETIKRILSGKFTLAQDNITIHNDVRLKKTFIRSIVLSMLDLKPNTENMVNNASIEEKRQSLIIQLKKFEAPEMTLEINEAIEFLNYIPQILSSDHLGFQVS